MGKGSKFMSHGFLTHQTEYVMMVVYYFIIYSMQQCFQFVICFVVGSGHYTDYNYNEYNYQGKHDINDPDHNVYYDYYTAQGNVESTV